MASVVIMKTGQTIDALAEIHGDFEDWIIGSTNLPASRFRTVSVYAGEALPLLDEVTGVIITGSPAMVTDQLDWIRTSEAFLQEAVARRIPVLGICFGHQLLAQALGGRVDYNPKGREIGTTQVRLGPAATGDRLFDGLPESFPVHVTHMQSVMQLPLQADILAGNDFDPHQGVRFADYAWGVQFHPEFNATIMSGYLRERYEQVCADGLDADSLMAQVREAGIATSLLQRFVDLVEAA